MNLFFRIFLLILSLPRKKPLKFADTSELEFRVLPNDLDIYGHMNNGRYLTLMDLGRMDWIWRTGLRRAAKKNRWKPLVAASTIRYRKSLTLWKRFTLRTRVLGWDDKWFYIEQTFKRGERPIANAVVKGLFRGPKGNIPPADILEAIDQKGSSPPLPDHVRLWIEAETLK
jgi:acyl-CoA thioesterase FadM